MNLEFLMLIACAFGCGMFTAAIMTHLDEIARERCIGTLRARLHRAALEAAREERSVE